SLLLDSLQNKNMESIETTHFSIVDKFGNAVSNTYTINGGFGAKIVIDGAGFFMNNEMDDFSAKPGVPNMFNLVGGEANAIQPEKRMLSSMTPTIITRDNKLFMIIGSPGGPKIITTVLQAIVNVIDFGMNIREAIEAPRFHHQWSPDILYYETERGIDKETLEKLISMGYILKGVSSMGEAEGIVIGANGVIHGWADTRGGGCAAGY
ncbi:MAG: gamma-glutamyltransferase, partial [Fidelibacterota bacterium]